MKLGGKQSFTKLLETVKLNNPFEEGTVLKVVKPLEQYLSQFDTKKFD